jgi:hypothetical protein
MTVFEVNMIFNGIACPHCNEKVIINFNNESLFTPFKGFVPQNNNAKDCCKNFHDQLNNYVSMHRDGRINDAQLIGELNLYK